MQKYKCFNFKITYPDVLPYNQIISKNRWYTFIYGNFYSNMIRPFVNIVGLTSDDNFKVKHLVVQSRISPRLWHLELTVFKTAPNILLPTY